MAKAIFGLRMALAGLALLTLGACAEVIRNHGYTPSDEELADVVVGRDTRETVAAKVGRPSAGGLMADSGWYYVQSRWSHRGARAPEEVDRQVLAVSFDNAGRVANVERFGLQDGQVVALSRRVTDTNIRGVGFIRQMLGNLGRFDAGQFLRQGL